MSTDVLRSLGRRVVGPVEYTLEVFLMIYLSLRAAFFDQGPGAVFRSVVHNGEHHSRGKLFDKPEDRFQALPGQAFFIVHGNNDTDA